MCPVRDELRRVGVTPMRCGYQMGSGYNVPSTTGWGSSVALSCWVRSVAEVRDEKVEPETWGKLPGSPACLLVSCVCLWSSVPVLFLGLVPSCRSGLLGRLSSSRVCFKKEATTQGTDPRTGFSDRPTTCRAGSPWWPGMRGDDPRTDLLTCNPFLRTSLQQY